MIRSMVASAAAALLLPGLAAAQDGSDGRRDPRPAPADGLRDMATDRPNLTDSPTTIDAGHLQIEAGLFDTTIDRTSAVRDRRWSIGDMNFRLGVLDNVELNLIVAPHLVDRVVHRRTGATVRNRGFDLGATAALGRNVVIDSGVGIGLTAATPDMRWLSGLSVRF